MARRARLGSLIVLLCASCSAAGSGPGRSEPAGAAGTGATPSNPIDLPETPSEEPRSGECTKVDLLFVVDDSASMADQQQSLIASFGGFVAGMKERLANAHSFHVGVVTTDAYATNEPGCTEIGDLVTRTGGVASSNGLCSPYASGARYMDDTEPDLLAKFACAAQVGVGGHDDERPMRALLEATKPATQGSCNAGFLRPDSLLVVTLVTDEDDVPDVCDADGTCQTYGSGGDPQAWYDQLVAQRGGLAQNVVVLSLLGTKLDNSCGAQVASKLVGFTKRFGANGHLGDVCAPSYHAFFDAALPVIETACKSFEPPK